MEVDNDVGKAVDVPATSSIHQDHAGFPIDLQQRCSALLSNLGTEAGAAHTRSNTAIPAVVVDYALSKASQSPSELLDALSLLLATEGFSELLVSVFEPIVLDLCARWLEARTIEPEEWEARLCVLGSISYLRPDLWSLIYAFLLRSPFRQSPLAQLPEGFDVDARRIHSLLVAYLRLLVADPGLADRLDWSSLPLYRFQQHPDAGVRLLAVQVLSKHQGLSEAKRMALEAAWVGQVDDVDAKVYYGQKAVSKEAGFELEEVWVDGWLLPIFEARRQETYASRVRLVDDAPNPLDLSHLSRHTILVGGTLVFRSHTELPIEPSIHVPTLSASSALRDIALRLQVGSPMLLSSSPSSGKTHLIQHLSTLLYPSLHPTHRVMTIPLADTSIDVKSLIGTYISSTTKPGTFEYMEGALTKAVRAGRWVVFDDIDRASTEMLVTIAGITRSLRPGAPGRRAELAIPGRSKVEAGDGFAVFATRSISNDAVTPPVFLGHQEFAEVRLEAPTNEDIHRILAVRFANLTADIIAPLVAIWQALRPLGKISGQVKARSIGLRDLEKWCARIARAMPSASSSAGPFANPAFQDEIMLEAADIFIASLDTKPSSRDKRTKMVEVVAKGIGMDEERAFSLLDRRRPTLELVSSSRQLIIGRTTLPTAAPEKRRINGPTARPFALTKPSLVLLERVAAAVNTAEPLLLVGETGTGKTTAVQFIADTCRKPLTALNLSMQTESSDLLGGFKPIDASVAARSIQATWQRLFCDSFSMGKSTNGAYLEAAAKALSNRKWGRCAELWSSSAKRAIDKLSKPEQPAEKGGDSPRKRRKVINTKAAKLAVQWQALMVEVADFDLHHVKMRSKLVFSFVEGPLVKALTSGEWILLDEINLASQETLEAISTILEGATSSLVLTERGDVEPIKRHPDFRLFACMNPATDVGKKDLPPNLRDRFTELYVPPPDDDRDALITIVSQYINDAAAGDRAVVLDVVEMYTTLKQLSSAKEIVDGSNTAPHFSMRTLARALVFAVDTAPLFGLRRALWEGCLMSFTMSLDLDSAKRAHEVCERHLLTPMKNARAVLGQIPALPASADPDDYVRFGAFWLKRGPLPPDTNDARYVITASVQSKLSDLARVILTHRYPVLIQGPTSAGKTSAVEFLARQTGHRFVRINNHEHTDIQEYLGTYVTDPKTGNLVFQEGLLVTAVRQGHWIVLDELNLAPTDVLEALNRLLDDNRELIIPETQEVIRPHPNFILFATQNPPGLYAGRKVLSRAFRNRFLEVHFDDVPRNELETILCQRCQIAPPYAKKIVQVFEELRHRRQASRMFESKSSFATLRDLFRWAERGAVGYEQLAEDGYMLLAERARQDEDKVVIKQVIEDVLKVTVDEAKIYRVVETPADSILARLPFDTMPASSLVWTRAMQRLFALVAFALAHNEPVLLVGETGCGKTSVCEVIAEAFGQQLVGVNCHQNMETADLLGSQRPVRNRHDRKAKVVQTLSPWVSLAPTASEDEISAACGQALDLGADAATVAACRQELQALTALFEWSDGPLVHAMQAGDLLLLDEVSLADDSVLERLNSVLEPGRTLVLAEKGGTDIDQATLHAHDRFHVVATMNPGGDFGKKELSPALRNRFTEIWVPPLDDRRDLLQIIESTWKHKELQVCGDTMLDFFDWFGKRIGDTTGMGLRDILAWVKFSDSIFGEHALADAFHHGGQMVIVDGLESLSQVGGQSASTVASLRRDCLEQLDHLADSLGGHSTPDSLTVTLNPEALSIGGFGIPRGDHAAADPSFRFEAPTTALNAMRVLRGCQLPKAILLEGSPGVGKTSLVSALAAVSGHRLQRINLSDQTDLIDLFGSDLPIEGGQAGEFQWRDAAFLDAMQKGDWVLLDEMNLASQTVLEGLNAVLDHRGTVFIPELGRSFDRHPDFRVFAAQNPLQQGGGRKGLPKSFLNRFTKVYLQEHTPEDLLMICRHLYPADQEMVQRMISFNEIIREATMVTRSIGREGSPWEFNLRDLFRWFRLLAETNGLETTSHPVEYLKLVYTQRFRNERDRQAVIDAFQRVFAVPTDFPRPQPVVTPNMFQIGHSLVERASSTTIAQAIRHDHLELAESVLKCIEHGWLVILSGESGSGKRQLLQAVAAGAGRNLGEFAMHPGVDTSEMLGSFEQQDIGRVLLEAQSHVLAALKDTQIFQGAASDVEQLKRLCASAAIKADDQKIQAFLASARALLASHPSSPTALAALDRLERTGPEANGFAWIDGQLLTAIREGGWFLLSNANLCSASVLDRLNSLCESNGVLVLSEKGSATGTPEVITPHPDFRLFMTYDPRHGELSRAMRNRGVELSVAVSDRGAGASTLVTQPALADHTLLRPIHTLDFTRDSASHLANAIASQPIVATSLLKRHGAQHDRSDVYEQALRFIASPVWQRLLTADDALYNWKGIMPIDPITNVNIADPSSGITFRGVQLLLRNLFRVQDLEQWVSLPENAKTLLAVSSRSSKGRSRSKMAGSDIWAVVSGIRDVLTNHLPEIIAQDGASAVRHICNLGARRVADRQSRVDALEKLLVFLRLLESRNSGEVFDYSSTRLLAEWIKDLLPAHNTFNGLSGTLGSLATSLSLTTGHGQAQIWSMFRDGADLTSIDLALIDKLSTLADQNLRRSVVDAIASVRKTPSNGDDVAAMLLSLVDVTSSSVAKSHAWANDAILGAIELEALAPQADNGPSDLLVASRAVPMMDVAALRTASSPAILLQAIATFMGRLWHGVNFDDAGQSSEGPAALFKPVRLTSVLRYNGTEPVKLMDLQEEQRSFQFSVDLALWNTKQPIRTRAGLQNIATQVLRLLAGAFGVPYHDTDDIRSLLDALKQAEIPSATLQELHLAETGIADLGGLWLGLSRVLIELYVTNIPIDPAVRRVLMGDVLASRLQHLEEELLAVEQAEVVIKGISDSNRRQSLRERIQSISTKHAGLGPTIDRSTDAGRLAVLFNEVHSFMDDAFSPAALSGLQKSLAAGHSQALERERGLQLSSIAFVQRLKLNYADQQDLVTPVVTAVEFGRLGMRLLARELVLRADTGSASVMNAIQFPLSAYSTSFQAMDALPSTRAGLRDLFICATSLVGGPTSLVRSQTPARLTDALCALYHSWSDIRQREQQEEQASESLYRVKKTDIEVLSDQELEEKEFAELFPSYEDEDGDIVADTEEEHKPDNKLKFDTEAVLTFHHLVMASTGTGNVSIQDATDKMLRSDFEPSAYDEGVDIASLPLQIRYLHQRLQSLQPATTHPNFYLEANEPEVRKAHGLILRLIARLDRLINDWPDQVVPQHIKDRCLAVLALHTRSPVAKVLTSLEQLLVHTNDWEGYADKANSLAAHQAELSALIVEWRRLELSSWMRLLDDQVKEYVERDAEWTMRLFGALVQGVESDDNLDKHLETTLPMITTYLSSSSLGHFEGRVETLKALGRLCAGLTAPAHQRVSTLLHNIVENASLFMPRILDSLRTQRAVIDKAIKDFVKLASWKDVNVYALKASAVKSHRQLHRNVRKFREVLRQPVAPILMDHNSICPQDPAVSTTDGAHVPTFTLHIPTASVLEARLAVEPAPPVHLVRFEDTLRKYQGVHIGVRAKLQFEAGEAIDNMAVDIIETAASLAKATPQSLTKENTKLVNNLASRKRKAYSDLLKALRAFGFSNSVRADQLAKQQSSQWISSLLPLPGLPDGADRSNISKIESYHHRLHVLMITLRAAFNGHNPDIASQDLERGIGFAESVYASALVERKKLVADVDKLSRLTYAIRKLEQCALTDRLGSSGLQARFLGAEADLAQIGATLQEVSQGITYLVGLDHTIRFPEMASLSQYQAEVSTCSRTITEINKIVASSHVPIFTSDEVQALEQAEDLRTKLIDSLRAWSASYPQFRHLLDPTAEALDRLSIRQIEDIQADAAETAAHAWLRSDDLIQSMLVVTQGLKIAPSPATKDDTPHLPTEFAALYTLSSSLKAGPIIDKLDDLVSKPSASFTPALFSRLLPFAQDLAETYASTIDARLYAVKSTYKLAYVVSRVVLDLAQKGFCKPQEESDDKGDGEDGDTVEGTGMGAGTGDKNVSKEIEEESQVEGLQGEQEEEQDGEQDKEDEDDAVSMDEDFEGALGDAKEGDEDGEGSEGEDEDERDDHVGDVDPLDPGAVDEKFWGDDEKKDEEQKENDGKEDLMNQKDEGAGESEMAAKESEGDKGKDKDKEQEQKDEAQNNDTQHEDDTQANDLDDFNDKQDDGDEGDDDEMDGEGEEQKEGGVQDQDDVAMPEGDRLDLPDDLDIGDDEGEGEGPEAEDFDDLPMDRDDDEPESGREASDGGEADEDDGEEAEDAPAPTGATEEEANEPDDTLNPNVDTSAATDNQAQQSAEAGAGLDGAEQTGQDQQPQQQDQDTELEAQGEGSAQDQQGKTSAEQDQGDGPMDSVGAPVASGNNDRSDRSLGDILQEIQRRRDEILAQQDRETETTDAANAPEQAPGQVEYLHQGDQDEGMQALGAAGEEERQKLEDLNIVDEEEKEAAANLENAAMDEDDQEDGDANPPAPRQTDATVKTETETDRLASEKALTQSDIMGQGPSGSRGDMDVDLDGEDVPGSPPPVKEEEDIEIEVKEGEGVVGTNSSGEDIWRQYASLTSDLSYALCEQLRLILEPTMATRLQGDFRTGKRLNMRKIIPYIASEYTKDKIWLRRTKPSRREYQVLLSLDDSRSMAESHSVHLAYQTLALVSQALNKLEVGQISIARFGESVDILHPFGDTGFAEADGAKVMNSFKFDQHKTDVAALVERSLTFLAEARQRQASSASAPDLWQLQVIISDGVCQDHHRLRTLLRRALEERVMIVFVIVDSLHQSSGGSSQAAASASNGRPSSILSMQTVEYKEVNGAMQLDMKRYLDTFPFEFYVVLRDVEALPGVLSDTLRQWMARVSQSNE